MSKNIIVFICILQITNLGAQVFSKEEVIADLDYLKSSLEQTHYDLYAYTSKEAFDANYKLVRSSIQKDSVSLKEATQVLQSLISKANNGHTEIGFPGSIYREYANANGTIFPLEVALEKGKVFIRKNWSSNEDIRIGSELLSINGVVVDSILRGISPFISAERTYFKNAKIELYSLPRLHWYAFGQFDSYEVEVLESKVKMTYQLEAIKVIDGYETKRDEILNAEMKLEFYDQAAYLNPGNFSGDKAKYQAFLDSAFMILKNQEGANLIIDLRNNGGGDDSFSDYLVSYIADRPFRWSSSYSLKSSAILKANVRKSRDTTRAFWKSVLDHKNGSTYEYIFEEYQPQPTAKRFKGEVFVLVNRQSHSQAAVTAAQIQDYGYGTIVGEETGDFPSLIASQFQYKLPNTSIEVNVSKGKIVRVNGSEEQEGVIPDIVIQDHLLDEKDEILEGLLERMSK